MISDRHSIPIAVACLIVALIRPLAADGGLFSYDSPRETGRIAGGSMATSRSTSMLKIPADVGHNIRGLFAGPNLGPLLIGSGVAGLATLIDENETRRGDDGTVLAEEAREGSALGRFGERLGDHYVVAASATGLAVAGQVAGNDRFERFSYTLLQGYIVDNLLTTGLKAMTHRIRPNGRNDRSFPSGHTSNAFTWATIVSHYYGMKAAIPAYGVAAFIGWSRVDVDAHYLSDVAFGAALGYIVGRSVVRLMEDRTEVSGVRWTPVVGPGEAGLVASLRW